MDRRNTDVMAQNMIMLCHVGKLSFLCCAPLPSPVSDRYQVSALVGVYLFLVEPIQLMFQFVDNILDIVVQNFILILQP